MSENDTPIARLIGLWLNDLSDRHTLALYVLGCDPMTYSPETAAVMDRMRPILLDEDGKLRDGSPGAEDIRIGGVADEQDDNPFEETNR